MSGAAGSPQSVEALIGRRGRLCGSHPWAGRSGEIVRVDRTIAGWAAVVRLDHDAREVMFFDGMRHWLPEQPEYRTADRLAHHLGPVRVERGGRRGHGESASPFGRAGTWTEFAES